MTSPLPEVPESPTGPQAQAQAIHHSLDEMQHRHGEEPQLYGAVLGLLTKKEVPSWYYRPYIYAGYRPVTHSVRFCLLSLRYLHNETVNIYSHLIPAAGAALLVSLVSWYFRTTFPNATRHDRLAVEIYLSTSVLCFATSSLYHTLLCHSNHYFRLWVRLDYATILLQVLGSFISGIYVGYYCEPELQRLYWSMVRGIYRTRQQRPVPRYIFAGI